MIASGLTGIRPRQHTLTATMNMGIYTVPMMNTKAIVALRSLIMTKKKSGMVYN